MASDEDPRQPLIDPSTYGGSSNGKYTEPPPATTISMMSFPTAFQKKNARRRGPRKKPLPTKDLLGVDLGRRLASMHELKEHICFINDIICILAFTGIVLMIIVNELIFHQVANTETVVSWTFRLLMTISTIVLIGFLLYYHRLDLSLYALRNCTDDWRVGLTFHKISFVVLEVLVCAIHPLALGFPGQFNKINEAAHILGIDMKDQSLSYVSYDVALGLPMFLRFYLLPRFLLYHSYLAHNAGSKTVGYLSQVSIDFYFLMKTYLDRWPIRCLVIFFISIFCIGSWSLRACDYTNDVHLSIRDAMWLFIETYTTVGFGDILPSTYCGRGVITLIVFIGLLTNALIIAVVSDKLRLTREEKYVHNFALNINLEKKRNALSADIVKYTAKIWISKYYNKEAPNRQRIGYRRQLFETLRLIHDIKKEQRGLYDNVIGLPEIAAVQQSTDSNTAETMEKIGNLGSKMSTVEEHINDVKQSINNIQNTLNLLVDAAKK